MPSEIADMDSEKEGNDAAGDGAPGKSPSFSKVLWLDLSKQVIEEKQKKHMARALENNKFKNLKSLFLHDNYGDIGIRAMLNALQESDVSNLEELILWNVSSYDQITTAEEGTDTIANAIGINKMPKLQRLDLSGSLPKLISPRPLMTVFRDLLLKRSLGEGRLQKCKNLFLGCCCPVTPTGKGTSALECYNCHMCGNYIYSGNDGLVKIVKALRVSRPPLKVLNLRDNHIGDKGVEYLAELLRDGVLPLLEEVDLQNNLVSEVGGRSIVRAYLANPLLTARVMLDWSDPILKERASAFREKNLRLEHRKQELGGIDMEQGKISASYEWNPHYSIRRPSKKEAHRFLILCQYDRHDHVSLQLESAGAVSNPTTSNPSPPRGIQIKRKSFFSTPPRNFVEREYEEVREEESPATSGTAADVNGDERADLASALCCPSSGRLSSLKRQQQPQQTTHDSLTVTAPSPQSTDPVTATAPPPDSADPTESLATIQEEESRPTVARKGKAVISITPGTRLFITAAKSLQRDREAAKSLQRDREEGRAAPPGRAAETGCWDRCKLALTDKEKTSRQIDAITMELLMFADRKPREFREMFGLTRVLLRDPDGAHYPAYVCDTCKFHLVRDGQFSKTVVKKRFLKLSLPAQQVPGPLASAVQS